MGFSPRGLPPRFRSACLRPYYIITATIAQNIYGQTTTSTTVCTGRCVSCCLIKFGHISPFGQVSFIVLYIYMYIKTLQRQEESNTRRGFWIINYIFSLTHPCLGVLTRHVTYITHLSYYRQVSYGPMACKKRYYTAATYCCSTRYKKYNKMLLALYYCGLPSSLAGCWAVST